LDGATYIDGIQDPDDFESPSTPLFFDHLLPDGVSPLQKFIEAAIADEKIKKQKEKEASASMMPNVPKAIKTPSNRRKVASVNIYAMQPDQAIKTEDLEFSARASMQTSQMFAPIIDEIDHFTDDDAAIEKEAANEQEPYHAETQTAQGISDIKENIEDEVKDLTNTKLIDNSSMTEESLTDIESESCKKSITIESKSEKVIFETEQEEQQIQMITNLGKNIMEVINGMFHEDNKLDIEWLIDIIEMHDCSSMVKFATSEGEITHEEQCEYEELKDSLIVMCQSSDIFSLRNMAAKIIKFIINVQHTWEVEVDLMNALHGTLTAVNSKPAIKKDVLFGNESKTSDNFYFGGVQKAQKAAELTVKKFKWRMAKWNSTWQSLLKRSYDFVMLHTNVSPILAIVYTAFECESFSTEQQMDWETLVMLILELHAATREHFQRVAEHEQGVVFTSRIGLNIPKSKDLKCGCISMAHRNRNSEEIAPAIALNACPKKLIQKWGGAWQLKRKAATRKNCETLPCNEIPITPRRIKQWMNTLNKKSRAEAMVTLFGAAAGCEHFQELDCQPMMSIPSFKQEAYETRMLITNKVLYNKDRSGDNKFKLIGECVTALYGDETKRASDMSRRKSAGGGPVTYTAGMVAHAMPGISPMVEYLHNVSEISDESEVCGATVAIGVLDIDIIQELLCSGMFDIPLSRWWVELKTFMTAVRRTLRCGNINGERLLTLRKLLNVTIRVKEQSDIRSEHYKRGVLITRKHLWGHKAWEKGGISAYTAYEIKFLQQAKRIISQAYETMHTDMLKKTIQEHWEERAMRGAAGASKAIKKIKLDIPELADADRPGKKVLIEFLDDNALHRIMDSKPTNRAYYFVKPEPGHKLRSLYASYDEEAFISSYANQSIENHMKSEPGVMVRQTPADVIEWMGVSEGGLAGPEGDDAYWLSTDYSDYNSEHTFFEMTALDWTCSHISAQEHNRAYNPDKAIAHAWNCIARSQSVIIYGRVKQYAGIVGMNYDEEAGYWFVTKNGLYSGSRTTARDNTWIHAIDLAIARDSIKDIVDTEEFRWWALCGDDEDVAFRNPVSAGLYAATLGAAGHAINPVKQLAGYHNHEFLQLTAAKTVRIEKPLNSLLATLATGNWYVQSGLWLQTVMNGVFSNYWELFCRGMPMQVCRRLVAYTMEHSLRIRVAAHELGETDETKKEDLVHAQLEWWKYRFCASVPPLFRIEENDEIIEPPKYEAVAKPTDQWPSRASKAYVRTHKKLLEALPSRIKTEFEQSIQATTVGACLRVWQQKQARNWCAKNWPKADKDLAAILRILDENPDWEKSDRDKVNMDQYRWGIPKKNTMMTEEAICGKMGVPFYLARKLGGISKLGKYVELEQWAKYGDTSTHFYPLSGNGYRLQTNLRAASSWATAPIEGIHGQKQKLFPKVLAYVYAGNGAGKTTIATKNRDVLDLDKAWLNLYGCIRDRYVHNAHHSGFTKMLSIASEMLQHAVKNCSVLIGQLDPRLMEKAAKNAHVKLRIYSFDPGYKVRKDRLLMRGWDEARVKRTLQRCDEAYKGAKVVSAKNITRVDDIVMVASIIKTERQKEIRTQQSMVKVPMRYVFTRSEAVTRKLEIDEESRLTMPVMAT